MSQLKNVAFQARIKLEFRHIFDEERPVSEFGEKFQSKLDRWELSQWSYQLPTTPPSAITVRRRSIGRPVMSVFMFCRRRTKGCQILERRRQLAINSVPVYVFQPYSRVLCKNSLTTHCIYNKLKTEYTEHTLHFEYTSKSIDFRSIIEVLSVKLYT